MLPYFTRIKRHVIKPTCENVCSFHYFFYEKTVKCILRKRSSCFSASRKWENGFGPKRSICFLACLVENEKMGLVQNVQSAFRLVENQNNILCPLLDRQCMRKCKILFFDSWKMRIWKNGFYQNVKSHFLPPEMSKTRKIHFTKTLILLFYCQITENWVVHFWSLICNDYWPIRMPESHASVLETISFYDRNELQEERCQKLGPDPAGKDQTCPFFDRIWNYLLGKGIIWLVQHYKFVDFATTGRHATHDATG